MRMIGVTPSQDDKTGRITINQDYLDAITRAGALPVLLPLTAEERLCRAMLARVDGLVLSGGADVEPARYGEERLPCCGAAAPLRDAMEYALCRLAVAADKPVLGICRGLQVLNCALGGSLYQDIGLQYAQAITHPRYDAPRGQVHAVEVLPGTRLEEISGGRKLRVNNLTFLLIMAGDDPADLAVYYGRAWAAVGSLMPQLDRAFVIKKRDVQVECDFVGCEPRVVFAMDLTVTLGRLLGLAIRYGIRIVKQFLAIKKKKAVQVNE